MRWSRVKQLVEERMAPSLQGRVEVHSTRYYSGQGRGWITVDKREVADMSHLRAGMESVRIANETHADDANSELLQPPLHMQWYASDSYAQVRQRQDIVLSQYEFHHMLWDSLHLAIEDALVSDGYLIRALAMLDHRLGKRRLREMQLRADEHPLVRQFYDLRCEAEGIAKPTAVA